MSPWRVTERAGARVTRSTYEALDRALTALERRSDELAADAPRETVDAKLRQFSPAEQVIARLELSGPERLLASVRAGVDIHGDGSVSAYRGRVRRVAITPERSQTAYDALRQSIDGSS